MLQNQGAFGGVTRYAGTEHVTYVLNEGRSLLATCGKAVASATGYCSAIVVGRLVDAAQ